MSDGTITDGTPIEAAGSEETDNEAAIDETGSAVGDTTTESTSRKATSAQASASDRPSTADRAPTPDGDRLAERLRAVERAVTGTESSVADLSDGATAEAEREELEARLDDVEARVEELEAATQALRGYAGSIRAVNRDVERRADLALARASDSDAVADPRVSSETATTASGDEVPSEAALDAAVPSERRREIERESAARSAEPERNDGDGRDDTSTGTTDDGSWRSGVLDRLRESL